MASTTDIVLSDLGPDDQTVLREVLGYLNFSGGKPDAAFQKNLSHLHQRLGRPASWPTLARLLRESLEQVAQQSAAFADNLQARSVLALVFDHVYPAYRAHHSDLLAHITDADLQQPFFLARICEAVLSQGGPWDETQRIVAGTLDQLNDFLGYRPIAVLENGRRCQPYPHERFRPIPLYIREAGAAAGPYHELIQRTIELLSETPQEILAESYFDFSLMDELALDLRAHDHSHPVNKRTNYLFGEWDGHLIDLSGHYRRFVIRKVILDALLEWMAQQKGVSKPERLYDAAAVLCGTILMASSISGSGPETHDSTVTLTSLLPKVARQRDQFYARLLEIATGARAKRLREQAELTQQPFGHVRQHLNMHLAQYGSRQVQHRHLAYLFARMGYAQASREEAAVIPAVSTRFECEIQWRVTSVRLNLEHGRIEEADRLLAEIDEHLHRGIACGAFVDPWNVLGFQGQFQLFACREDSVPDQRVETLLQLMEEVFDAYSSTLAEAAAQGTQELAARVSERYRVLAEFWDQFGTSVIDDLPEVLGRESWESATRVAHSLSEWRAAGEAAGDISFWRQHVERFESAKAYAQVVDALLHRRDHVAALGLLMQWLSQAEDVGLESSPHSLHTLLTRWMQALIEEAGNREPQQTWDAIRRMFDYVEANAGSFWSVPAFSDAAGDDFEVDEDDDAVAATDEPFFEEEEDEDEEPGEESLFGAAYEGVTYRDSAHDGQLGETFDASFGRPPEVEFEMIERSLEPRIKFVRTLAHLWQMAATIAAEELALSGDKPAEDRNGVIGVWLERLRQIQRDLQKLLDNVWNHEIDEPSGDHDSNIEYDLQLQTKLYLLQAIISTHISCQSAEWSLMACLSGTRADEHLAAEDRAIVNVYRGIMRQDVEGVRQLLPTLLQRLSRRPLLYVPLDHGGEPRQVLAARTLQSVIRFLLAHLPRLGMLRETWHLLNTAQRMERSSRPRGLAVTEFDRLFRIALRNSLECAVTASDRWKSGRFSDEELIEIVGEVVERYLDLWLEHSSTMRLSTVEALKHETVWEEVRDFIERYGSDLFHARFLTLGNVRAVLHSGIERFLEYLAENEDPLHRIRLLEDIEQGVAETEDVVRDLELIYGTIVDKFDRFLEYNTTTTQSDYGEKFYTLLDFLRREIAYDRDAWNLMPVSIAHEVLARRGKAEAARIWGQVFAVRTGDMAIHHLAELRSLETMYGMRLPSITDHLNERFVKPLAVNSMQALVPRAMDDARQARPSPDFDRLRSEIASYVEDTSGSGLDVPAWLRNLEDEVDRVEYAAQDFHTETQPELRLPEPPLNLREMRHQLRIWKQPLKRARKSGR